MTTELTNSSLSTFMTCPEKYRLAYVERIKPEREADYFRIGGAYHLGHETYGKTGSVEEAELAITENYQNPPAYVMEDADMLRKWFYECVTCLVLFREHVRYYADRAQDTVLQTEFCFDVPIRNPETGATTNRYRRRGKIDKIIRLGDGRNAVLEYKTSSEDITQGSDYWWRLKIDSQISGYYIAAREMGFPIHTVIYDVARKPTIRPSQMAICDSDGVPIVLDQNGERVRCKTKKNGEYPWRTTADADAGYILQSRPMTNAEWLDKLTTHIRKNQEWYYQRGEVVRLDSDLRDYEHDLWSQQRAVAEAERTGRWYKNTRQCSGRSQCTYFRVCTQRLTVSDTEVPDGFVRSDVAHEELDA